MSNRRGMARCADRVGRVVQPVAGLFACVILCVEVGGCADGPVTRLHDAAEVKQAVLQDDKPVLVDFYKGGCPTCIPVDGMMAKLAEEYAGRATVAKFMLMQPYFVVTSPQLKEQYAISTYPTVILFVNGRETWRFLRDYEFNDYRKALNEALGAVARRAAVRAASRDIARSPGK